MGKRLGLGLLAVLVIFLIVGLARPRHRPPGGGGREPPPEAPGEGSAQVVPRTIFTDWSGPPDDLAEKCMARMRAANPHWDFVRLGDDAQVEPCEGLDRLGPQHRSDWVRLCALEEHGGVWLDATVVCVRPLEAWVDLGLDNLQGFSAWHPEVLENWALASPPRHPLVSAWKAELRRAIGMGYAEYQASAPPAALRHGLRFRLPYLTAFACYRVAAEETGLAARTSPSFDGPYAYMYDWAWTLWGCRALKSARAPQDLPLLLKIGKYQRRGLRRYPCVEGSPWDLLGLDEALPRTEAHDLRDFAISLVGAWLGLAMDAGLAISTRL